jgi:hypothetical protein
MQRRSGRGGGSVASVDAVEQLRGADASPAAGATDGCAAPAVGSPLPVRKWQPLAIARTRQPVTAVDFMYGPL